MDSGETVIVEESDGPFFIKKSRRLPNNTMRRMRTPDTYVIDKRGRLWRPKNAEGDKLDFSREGGSRNYRNKVKTCDRRRTKNKRGESKYAKK
jgi:hypothetical protein